MANKEFRPEMVKSAARDAFPPGASLAERVAIAASMLGDVASEIPPLTLTSDPSLFIAAGRLLSAARILIPVIETLGAQGL